MFESIVTEPPSRRRISWWIPVVSIVAVLVLVAAGMGWFLLTRPGLG